MIRLILAYAVAASLLYVVLTTTFSVNLAALATIFPKP